jgi:hypothetical protein
MQIKEFSKPVTSQTLNENVAKKFGYKLNLEQFSDVQLEDVRNKLRTEVSQFEMSESYDSVHESPKYQKTRALLDVINQEIMERDEGKCTVCKHNPCDCEEHEEEKPKAKAAEKAMKSEGYIPSTIRQRASMSMVPQTWINKAISRIELGESDKAELKAELTLRYDLSESQASWILLEGEEDKAEIIMATKDMVDRITGWLEDVATMKAEQLLELLDSIREQSGSDVAEQYSQAIKPALENIYSTLESTRQSLTQGLALVSGGEAPTMGGGAPTMGAEEPTGDEMGAIPGEETPPAADLGREKRESVDYSRKLAILLNSKKK